MYIEDVVCLDWNDLLLVLDMVFPSQRISQVELRTLIYVAEFALRPTQVSYLLTGQLNGALTDRVAA